jgi:POT family proton-dependent oligopeptide transporter
MVEMWERFAFYGMRALLVLFLVAPASHGGLGLQSAAAESIYGIYTALALLIGLLGGWLGDHLLGSRAAVISGGVLNIIASAVISSGAYFGSLPACLIGLLIDATGTGFLKTNVSVMVAALYPEGGSHRDAGFNIFYMGINVGAVLGALSAPLLASRFGWWAGFAGTALGMSFGLAQLFVTQHHLGDIGKLAAASKARRVRRSRVWTGVALGGLALCATAALILWDPVRLARLSTLLMVAVGVGGFALMFMRKDLRSSDRRHLWMLVILGIALAIFIIGYQQVGTSISLFIQRYANRRVGGWIIPAGAFQSLLPAAVAFLAPWLARLWVELGNRGMNPSPVLKYACALLLLSMGFLIMAGAAHSATGVASVSITWVVATLLVQAVADLLTYPIGLSAVSELSPPGRAGFMMGLWFVAGAVGNIASGVVAGTLVLSNSNALMTGFLHLCIAGAIVGIALLLGSRTISALGR